MPDGERKWLSGAAQPALRTLPEDAMPEGDRKWLSGAVQPACRTLPEDAMPEHGRKWLSGAAQPSVLLLQKLALVTRAAPPQLESRLAPTPRSAISTPKFATPEDPALLEAPALPEATARPAATMLSYSRRTELTFSPEDLR